MRYVQISGADFGSWRRAARGLLEAEVPPERVVWNEGEALFNAPPSDDQATSTASEQAPVAHVPKEFVSAAQRVAFHRDPSKWPLLYRLLWRLTHGEPHLLRVAVDDDVRGLFEMDKSVRRDVHKMHAFVRFRKVSDDLGEHYVAWHRPDHPIVRHVANFFRQRFGVQRWTILTPDESVSWDGHSLTFGPGVPQREAPQGDEVEAMWKTYYASIFNPARVKVRAMKKEMPVRHWATLPEAELIDDLLRDAPRRVEEMVKKAAQTAKPSTHRNAKPPGRPAASETSDRGEGEGDACAFTGSARNFIPGRLELPVLAKAAQGCKGCEIYCHATQAVFGEGAANATIVMVGEQPGDSEDRQGKPFVGPAGQLLNDFLLRVGLPRDEVYVTNAVKHFKFEQRGTRRIHAKPSAREVAACHPWLEAELQIIKPEMLVCLGATAAQSLLGRDFRITKSRGQVMTSSWAPWTIATLHPSALLRIPDPALREQSMADFESDLRKVAEAYQDQRRG